MKISGAGLKSGLGVFLTLCVCIILGLHGERVAAAGADPGFPQAIQGQMNLQAWDFAREGLLPLNGQWEFYPDKLLEPADFRGAELPEHDYLKVPGSWQQPGVNSNQPYGKWGYGTYRLIVQVKQTDVSYGIRTNGVFMSSKLFVDGQLIGESGSPAATKGTYQPQNLPYTGVFYATGNQIEIVMQVANFDHYAGGIGVPLYLGYQQEVAEAVLHDTSIQAGSAVALLVFAVIFLILFVKYIRERDLLLFALFFIFFAGNILVNGEKLLLQFLPQLEFEASLKIKNIMIYIGTPILYYLTKRLYRSIAFIKLLAIPAFIVAGYCAAILLLPYSRYIAAEKFILYIVLLFYILHFIILIINDLLYRRKNEDRKEFRLYTASVLLLLLYKVYNILYVRFYAPKSWIATAAIIAFILLISMLLIQRYVKAYSAMTELTDKLQAAEKLKDEFLLRTSLELKTPIQRILNLSEPQQTIADLEAMPEAVQKLHMVRNMAFRLSNMVDDLVDLTKIRDGKLPLSIQTTDVAACTAMVFEVLEFIADGKRVDLQTSFAPEARFAAADEKRLMQVLYRLIDDGLRNMEQGRVTVGSRGNGASMYITLDLAGKGTLLERPDIIMQAFDHRKDAVELDSRGLGWSYSIAEKLVELMNGTFTVIRQNHGGLRYEIMLPAAEPPAPGSPAFGLQSFAAEKSAGGQLGNGQFPAASEIGAVTVLIIESEAGILEVLIHLLAMEGYKIIAARSGEEALQHIEGAVQPDLVLMNMMMDGSSGYETARAIRRRFSLIELPILFIAGRNTPADVEVGLEAGGNDYITKPVDAGEVRARIRTLLTMKKQAREAAMNEMAFLQSQIKPHFLYNALGTIMSLCYTDGRRAGKLLAVFSKYVRMLFQLDNTQPFIPLRKELELIQAYVEIEKERFGSRLQAVFDIDDELLDCQVAPLTIQPLVENAIHHGIAKKLAGGIVWLTVKRDEDLMRITVGDDGMGMSEQTVQEVLERTTTSKGVGFASIRKRAARMTNKPFILESIEGSGTEVTFWLPVYAGGGGEPG